MRYSTRSLIPTVLAITVAAAQGSAQGYQWYTLTFDNSFENPVVVDTTDGHHGLWQIGSPQKSLFTAANSAPNVIVTDTLLPYPPNDTSRFSLVHIADGGWSQPQVVVIEGYYQVDADSLMDRGTIEFSYPGSGWIDLLNDPIFAPLAAWSGDVPSLIGRSNGWLHFYADLWQIPDYLGSMLGQQIQEGDTIRWRFSFVSDSLDSARDGLMFDDLHFEDWSEAIPEYSLGTFHSTVAPMPSVDHLDLIYETVGLGDLDLIIRNSEGRIVRTQQLAVQHRTTVPITDLGSGMYFYELRSRDATQRSYGRFVKL